MAPHGRAREASIERTEEYTQFMADLAAYHEKRGTTLEPEPRVGTKHVDFLRLYKVVTGRGGYDVVCSEKLQWRKIGQDFSLGTANLAAQAFNLKSAYYRNLAAYEISNFHGREPPPREILEDISARGSDILHRTVENFKPHGIREQSNLVNGDGSDGSEDEQQNTPKDEKVDTDDPGSGGRVTRGLRQAPPQRVLFQPDVSSSRQIRHTSASVNSPQPPAHTNFYGNVSNSNNSSFGPGRYEPRTHMPLTLRPVVTPSNNYGLFKERQRLLREAKEAKDGRPKDPFKGMMLPGTGFEGPNIYVRTLLSLRSGIPEEQDYALHHLVKISHERGDKYKFDAFPGLAEGLMEKVLEISSLFYDVEWKLSFKEDGTANDPETLDGMHGTSNILQKIKSLRHFDVRDDLETEEFSQRLTRINEASLVLRNMVMLEENAQCLSRLPPVRDWITIALNLPPVPVVTELQHYALDIAEQLTKFFSLDSEDSLYLSLLAQLDSLDRGAILTSLRAISRISMNLDENNRLQGVPISVIQRIYQWTLVDDEELVHACLDFLYQFTAVIANVELMVDQMNLEGFINQLVRLLLHGAREVETSRISKAPVKETGENEMPNIPLDLLEQLLKLEEPDRSAHWLQCCFEEDSDSDITQIALWQAYQSRFLEFNSGNRLLLPAAEFIKNVSTTFAGATAQVLPGPNPKFIIKGIRPRRIPLDTKGRVYQRCLWKTGPLQECGAFLLKPKAMWEHIISEHLQAPRHEDGRWDFTIYPNRVYHCHWSTCRKYPGGSTSIYDVGMHVKTHLPDTTKKAPLKVKHNLTRDISMSEEAEIFSHTFLNTTVDERDDAAGLPLTAVLVLRNFARNLPKEEAPGKGEGSWMRKLFGPVEPRLWFVMAHNKPLAGYMADLMATIAAGA
ncbi:MAG: Chromatin structure-remodeling complex protein rsc9 [Sclerophora amabilis]|nr:MAG: Chromatin structure-remodeling complex protein rsc9 [Sclerophora amabilis]